MSNNPLVSVVAPCYNGEKHIRRFLDAILYQTYDNIELILVNDGSTDSTEGIILSYKTRFKKKGFVLNYIYQENKGVSGAMDNALRQIKGKYFAWFDSDDMPYENNIELKVKYFENNSEIGMVFCRGRIVEEDTKKNITYVNGVWADNETQRLINKSKKKNDHSLFYALIMRKGGCYSGNMIRTSKYLEANPTIGIYSKQRMTGQNWQIMLPVVFLFPCGYIDLVLMDYYKRKQSHSTSVNTFEKLIEKTYADTDVLYNTLNSIDSFKNLMYYITNIDIKYTKKRLKIYCDFKSINLAKNEYLKLKKLHARDFMSTLEYFKVRFKLLQYVYVFLRRLKKLIKG